MTVLGIRVAELGEDDVFVGLKSITEGEFDATKHIPASEFGGDCDLDANGAVKYRWSRERKRFEPLNDPKAEELARMIWLGLDFAAARTDDGDAAEYRAIVARRFPLVLAVYEESKVGAPK